MPSTTFEKLRLSCKSFELIVSMVCIGLSVYAPLTKPSAQALISITFGGYVIILVGLLLGFITKERVPKRIDLLFTIVGVVLFLAAGGVVIKQFHGYQPLPGSLTQTHQSDTYYGRRETQEETHEKELLRMVRVGLAMGALAIINGVVFLADGILSYKDCCTDAYAPAE